MKFKIKKVGRHDLVNNGVALVAINGVDYTAIRQGILGFWAGQFRAEKAGLGADDFKKIDSSLDAALEKFDRRGRK